METIWQADSINDLPHIAAEIIQAIAPIRKIAFYGQMGAGKTTCIKAMCAYLGIQESTSSPTFAIVNTYQGAATIYHFDLFRINSLDELQEIGFGEYLDQSHYVFIEWPQIIEHILDDYEFARVTITVISAHERQVHVRWN